MNHLISESSTAEPGHLPSELDFFASVEHTGSKSFQSKSNKRKRNDEGTSRQARLPIRTPSPEPEDAFAFERVSGAVEQTDVPAVTPMAVVAINYFILPSFVSLDRGWRDLIQVKKRLDAGH